MDEIFVDRLSAIDKFGEIIQGGQPQWILTIGGSHGIGKTKLLEHLVSSCCPPGTLAVTNISFASLTLRNDPLSFLDILEHELVDHCQSQAFEAYQKRRKYAYEEFEQARIEVKNEIIVEAGGKVTADTIKQEAVVDLSKIVQERRIRMWHDLAKEFADVIGAYLRKTPDAQIIIFMDDFDSLHTSVDGSDYADWCLGHLCGGMHRHTKNQLKLVVSDSKGLHWLESLRGKELPLVMHILESLPPEDVHDYLWQRSITDHNLQQVIYELTKGHPLCVALTADLCCLVPTLTAASLKRFTLEPFDSEALAYRLFQGLVEQIPDQAMQRLLQYGPVLRVINDKVMRHVLAPTLDCVGREDQLLRDLGNFSCVDGTKEFSFKPIIRQRYLEDLRQKADALYQGINLQAATLYETEARQAQSRVRQQRDKLEDFYHQLDFEPRRPRRDWQKMANEAIANLNDQDYSDLLDLAQSHAQSKVEQQKNELETLYHHFNLEPRQSRRQWQRMADEAMADLDYHKLSALLDLAQSPDFGWISPNTRDLDKGIIKEYEARYYLMTGRTAQAEVAHAEARRLIEQKPSSSPVPPPSPPTEVQPPRVGDGRKAKNTGSGVSNLRPIGQAFISLLSLGYRGLVQVFTWLFVFISYSAKTLGSSAGSVIHWLTSPLRRLERYLRRLRRIIQILEKLQNQVIRELIPSMTEARNTARDLQNYIGNAIFPRIRNASQSAQQLAKDIRQALNGRDGYGRVTAFDFAKVDSGISQHQQLIRAFNQELTNLRSRERQFRNTISNTNNLATRLGNKLQELSQERQQLAQEAHQIDRELRTVDGQVSPEELTRVNEIMREIDTLSQRGVTTEKALVQALEQYKPVAAQAQDEISELNQAIHSLNRAISELNQFIAQFNGTRLDCVDGRSLTIFVQEGRNEGEER